MNTQTPHGTRAYTIYLLFILFFIATVLAGLSSCSPKYGCASVKNTAGYVPYKK